MQRLARILVVAAFAVLLAGCAVEPVVETTPSPAFTSEAEAFAAAEATYRAYVDALNQVDLADPETFEAVYAWTTGEANAAAREYLTKLHADGVSIHGESRVGAVYELSVSNREVSIAACLNVDNVDLLDAEGNSVVDIGRPAEQSFEILLVYSNISDHGLVIDQFSGGEKTRCG